MASSTCSLSSPSDGKWLRLARLLIDEGTNVLKQFFLFSLHPETLENTLKKNSSRLSKVVVYDDQREKLFPASGDPPNADKFDITLLCLLIREFSNLPAPSKGWKELPEKTDDSIQANITRIKCFRNELFHPSCTTISESEFEEKWNQISSSLEGILVYLHKQKIRCLKNDPIDDNMRQILEDHIKEWRELNQQDSEFIYELSSCLPDQISEESVHGRSNEVALVKDHLENDGVAVVLITGGPGFGKTTVARMAAQKLKESGQTVLFCSLQGKKTFDEVATEMIHSCRKMPGQLPDRLEYWLKNWSKQISHQLTVLILDNADSIIESKKDDRALFLETLSTMRRLSGNNLTFVITSRTRLQDVKSWTEVKLSPLSHEEAKKVLISRVNCEERKTAQFSYLDTIVELCGFVPLALSIVGSLLSDYREETLLKHLEKEPMAILEGDSESFPQAIANSFDLLLKAEQDALVAVSVFPGSFDCNAAEAVLKEYVDPRYPPIKALISLKKRSLVEQERARCKLHPLIRAFGKMIGETKSPQILQNSEQLARVHFLSRLEENARTLYWGKDTCRESIESFGEDRHNYEFFLQNMTDHEISSCQLFLDNFAQTCQYLDKCSARIPYIQFLNLLPTCKSFESQTHPVLRVELLCLLGEEMRRTGKNEKYREYMEEARDLFSEYLDEFETRALSHVFYLHNQARFVSAKKKRYDLEPKELYDKALEICEKKIPNHPERALNLLFAGRNAKRRKAYGEADEKLKKALTMLRNLLGDHFMTALCLKDLGDFYFFSAKTEPGEELEKALNYYKEAMEVIEKLGTRNQKDSVLTLKNYGSCHLEKGNFEEAKVLLLEANLVCDSEIEGDHTWKVSVKTELALFYHEIAHRKENGDDREELLSKMEEFMKEGLDMCYSLNDNKKSISDLGNRKQIAKLLNKYQERFERETYYPDEPL